MSEIKVDNNIISQGSPREFFEELKGVLSKSLSSEVPNELKCKVVEYISYFMNNFSSLIKPETPLFRVRKYDSWPHDSYAEDDMFPSTTGSCSHGRANAIGDKVIYLAESIDIALRETAPLVHQKVAIAEFNIKKEIKIIDLTDFSSKALPREQPGQYIGRIIHETFFYNQFSKDAKGPDDSTYLATTFIVNEFKRLGYDGVKYFSSKSKGGKCYAIFDTNELIVSSLNEYRVSKVSYDLSRLSRLKSSSGKSLSELE